MPDPGSRDRYPGYDVLAKRNTPSWNARTREVIDQRLALPREPRFFTEAEYATVIAVADRIVPQPGDRPPIPVAALVDHRLFIDQGDGYRHAGMPRARDAWRQGLRALDAEAQQAHGRDFRCLHAAEQDALLRHMQDGTLQHLAWGGMPPQLFFRQHLGHDIALAYYAHPIAWNEIGWGGPASPRGYVRTGYDRRDPWEAAEVKDGDAAAARRKNVHVG
ncbi:Gluconate 2-dehydrogenase subunit 3 family protein [Rhodovastum atsumiense]|uniref:Gluconate 2-dehydrogenase subunit 3 family protein n=1 Tax=Rhodovastum atsumiense TaxID=504468 RepID=A0A5M6IY89_9PROT|nr:gluconate 2-dehydrogenase subunit 3 family protein [Rhodovastum atsumiense]KAA5613310.1 gluconate 2-dehydrogenase subunit 3 family protein [Rhodovastum atsumiense]CAH2600513.1 Gluconate 2-dehydrogenase subunit 3 family protein [Rhodovastum atsumiense]